MGRESRNNPRIQAMAGLAKTQIYDRYARPIRPGNMINLNQPYRGDWFVEAIQPIVADPRMPPGQVTVLITAKQQFTIQGGMPIGDVLRALNSSLPAQMPNTGDPEADQTAVEQDMAQRLAEAVRQEEEGEDQTWQGEPPEAKGLLVGLDGKPILKDPA